MKFEKIGGILSHEEKTEIAAMIREKQLDGTNINLHKLGKDWYRADIAQSGSVTTHCHCEKQWWTNQRPRLGKSVVFHIVP